MASTSDQRWKYSLIKLCGILLLLPFLVTYAHLRYVLYRTQMCFVGPDLNSKDSNLVPRLIFGMYQPHSMKFDYKHDRNLFKPIHIPFNGDSDANAYGDDAGAGAGDGTTRWWRSIATKISISMKGYPSVASIATIIATPTSSLLKRTSFNLDQQKEVLASAYQITFDTHTNQWCFVSQLSTSKAFCRVTQPIEIETESKGITDARVRMYPPSGQWILHDRSKPQPSLSYTDTDQQPLLPSVSITCPGPELVLNPNNPIQNQKSTSSIWNHFSIFPKNEDIKLNPNKRRKPNPKPNQNLQKILSHPSTTLLLCLNIFLAFTYWNRRIDPSRVSKIYNKIARDHELWRSFTGATAHFEPMHIGFNMMSLYALGHELESTTGYGSIPFFFKNISLVPLTTMVMMTIIYLQIRYTGNPLLGEISTVGYSGVLFAWMVVTSLERKKTCPLPFVPGLCFETHSFFGGMVRLNISPIVQLFASQFIMPRVSFVGHLSGIICGFILHWNILPEEIFWSPHVFIPGLMILHWWFVRRIIPVRHHVLDTIQAEQAFVANVDTRHSNLEEQENGGTIGSGVGNHTMVPRKSREELGKRRYVLLVAVRNVMVLLIVPSICLLDKMGSMVFAQILAAAMFSYGVRYNYILICMKELSFEKLDINEEKNKGGIIWRGSTIALVLIIVTDAMTIAAWIVTRVYIPADRPSLMLQLIPVTLFTCFRIGTNFASLLLVSGLLYDFNEVGEGIFVHVFGRTIHYAKNAVDGILLSSAKPLYTPFEGRGVTLGFGRSSTSFQV